MKDDYLVKLDAFEGPMDLLMHLIEKNKIDLYDIPIADLTRQYLDHIDRLYQFDIEYASEFLVMAATLLRIKARMLLPPAETDEEQEEDPRRELVERLLEYRRFNRVDSRNDERCTESLCGTLSHAASCASYAAAWSFS